MGFTWNRKEHFLKKDVFTLIKQGRSAGVFCVFHLFFNVNLALRLKKASYPHISRCQHGDTERQQQHVPGRPQPCNVAQAYQDLHSQAAPHSIHHFQWLFFITLSEDSHLKLYVMCCVIRANYSQPLEGRYSLCLCPPTCSWSRLPASFHFWDVSPWWSSPGNAAPPTAELSPARILNNNPSFFLWYFHTQRKMEKPAATPHCFQTIGLVRKMSQTTFETVNIPRITMSQWQTAPEVSGLAATGPKCIWVT